MDTLVGYGLQFVHALVSPVNCVGNLGSDILGAFGSFAVCVGHNLVGAAGTVASAGATIAGIGG